MIKYGSIIRIHGYDNLEPGLLVAKSFTDQNVYFMKYGNVKNLNNYRESLFQILPRGSFEIHDEFQKSTEKEKNNLVLRLKTEIDQYKIVIQNKMNEEVLFGAEIVLKHVDSEYYLIGTYNCSEFCTDAFKLELTQFLSTQAVFKLLPSYSYQQEGQPVYLNEAVMLEHDKTKCRIDYVKGHKIFLDQQFECSIKYKYRPQTKKSLNRWESVITNNSSANWYIQLHEDYQFDKDKLLIKPFELCVFRNTENDSYLAVSGNKAVLKHIKQPQSQMEFPFDAIWQIEPQQTQITRFQDCTPPKNSPPFIPITPRHTTVSKSNYIIRHCMTGKILNSMGGLSNDASSVLQIFQVSKGQEQLKHNQFVKIMQNQSELQVIHKANARTQEEDQDLFYKSLDQNDLEYEEYEIGFKGESKHAFQICKVNQEQKHDFLTILSSQELLLQFADILKLQPEVVEKYINPKILNKVVSQLQKLICYLVNDISGENSESNPLQQRQRYMKELQMVEIIIEIIYYMSYKNGFERLLFQWKSDRERTKLIFQLAHNLIEKLVKSNPITKLHVSQWLELFLHSAMIINDSSVQNCLSELLDNNYLAISKFLTKASIKQLIDILQRQMPHEKYLKILSSICICNNKSIISNQINTLTLFFKQTQLPYKIQIKKIEGQVLIQCALNKDDLEWRTLNELYQQSQARDELQMWNYFLSYLNLLGDVCTNRNKFAKQYVEENFELDTLCCLLEVEDCIRLNAIEPILKVIHGAYLDCQCYTPIRRLARVREWGTIHTKKDILKTHAAKELKPENCDVKRVMDFIVQFIKNFKSFECKNSNQNLYCILTTLRTTLTLGFWLSITYLQNMLPDLFKILDTQNEKHIQQEIKCKILVCEIVDIMIDMETNVRVSLTTNSLKVMLETQKEKKNLLQIEEDQQQESSILETPRQIDLTKKPMMTLTYLKNKKQQSQEVQSEFQEFDVVQGISSVLNENIDEKDAIYNKQEWINLDKKLICDRNLFVHVKVNIESILQRLSYYEDSLLLQLSLNMLNRMYSQRTELRKNFSKVIIVATGVTLDLSYESRVTRTKLLAIVDRNILQYTFENQKDYNIYLWKEGEYPKETGIIQDIHQLVETMKQNNTKNRKRCAYESLFPSNALDPLYNECETPHKLHQSLLKSQNLHDNIIAFLEIIGKNQCNELIMKFLHACYKFLSMLIWNHLENKQEFGKYRHLMYHHIQYNICCIDFFKELFKNNKTLLFSEKDVSHISSLVIDQANKLSTKYYYKSKLLDFLRILLIYNDKVIKYNQVLVMSKIQEKQNNNIMFLLNPLLNQDDNLYDLDNIIKQIEEYENQSDNLIISISPELTYLFTFFEIFALLVEDRNTINPGKCKQMHIYPQLLTLLSNTKSFWPLKKYVRSYINRLYYDNNNFENISQLMIEKDLNNIIIDFDMIIEEKQKSQIKIIENPVRYTYLNSYVYQCLEETLISLNVILSQEQFLYDLEDILYQNFQNNQYIVHLQLFEIGNKLSKIKKLYSNCLQIEKITKVLIETFTSIFDTFDINLLLIREGLLNETLQMKCVTETVKITRRKLSGSTITEESTITYESNSNPNQLFEMQSSTDIVKSQLISNIFENQQEQQISSVSGRKVKSIKRIYLKTETDINEELNKKHRRLVSKLAGAKRFQRFLAEEFMQLCEKLYNQEQEKLKDFIRNSIKLNIQHRIPDHLKIFLLRLLTRMITEKNQKNKEQYLSIDQWQPDYWNDCKSEIEQIQHFLENCGAAEFICTLMQEANLELRMELTNELLTFIIAFLLGGNTKCQNSILKKLFNDQANIILNNFASMIKKIGRAVYNNYKIRKTEIRPNQLNIDMVDSYDYYDQTQMIMKRVNVKEHDQDKEKQFKAEAIQILCKSFRTLQLLSENNNVDMKNYMRVQTDSDGNVKLNTINFIEFTTLQLRMFLKILSKPILLIPTAMIDFLSEIIQLPCLENQIMLCKTTFYEDTCYMSRYLQNAANQKSRLFKKQDDLWDLYELQNKILLSVMSVLEGNDDKIYEDLQNKLEPRFLIDYVKQNLSSLEVNTCEEMNQMLAFQKDIYSNEILRILNVIIIKKKIEDKISNSVWIHELLKLSKEDEQLKEIFTILEKRIRNIEIIYGGKQQKIFFPSHPLFEYISATTKNKLMDTVSRDTQREKILGLLEAKKMIFDEIEYHYEINLLYIPVSHNVISNLRAAASLESVLINVVMVLFYDIEVKGKEAILQSDYYEKLLLHFLALLQLVTSLAYVLSYMISRIPLTLKLMPNHQANLIKKIYYVLANQEDLYELVTFVAISILGQMKPYFFSLHFFDLFSRLSLLQNVFQAISYNAKQLFLVALLGVMFVYVFSITGLNQYIDEIYPDEDPKDACDSLISCMITLITSGVIGTSMSQWDPVKFILDTVYFVFFALLFTNIVSGIMIDTFAELRDQRQKIEDDKRNLCFICGVDRQSLEKNGEEFETHIKQKHYLWNYIYYIYILEKKDSTEYTGLEYWISDKIENEDINWFPIINLEQNQMNQLFDQIQSQINSLGKKIDEKYNDLYMIMEQQQ